MKKQIRRGVFETNSSSTHSCTIMMKSEYDKWCNGYDYFYNDKAYTKEEINNIIKEEYWGEDFYSSIVEEDLKVDNSFNIEKFENFDDIYYELGIENVNSEDEKEVDITTFTTPSGEEIVAMCKTGWD